MSITSKKKYRVITAASGRKGLDILHHRPEIRIVFSDMKMPEMNGIEFIKQVKKINPNIGCYMLTGYDLIDEIKEALKHKLINKCFVKPLNIPEIHSTIINELE